MPGAAGDHLLGYQYAGYITEEDTFVEDGALVLRNQKRSFEGQSPQGQYFKKDISLVIDSYSPVCWMVVSYPKYGIIFF